MSKIIVIDAGHGGHDPGASANGLKEKDIVLDIAKRFRKKLNKYNGVKIIMTRTTDKFISLTERANKANRNKADLFISIHINSGGGTGFESYIYNSTVSSNTFELQNIVHKEIVKEINSTDRGKKRANLAVVRQTKMPAMLTENLFIDNKTDANKLKNSKFLDEIAAGHEKGISKYLGIKKKSSDNPKKSNPKPSSYKGNSLVDYLKSISVNSSYANRKKLAMQNGISNYRGTVSQNTKLLNKLRSNTTAGKPKGDQKTNSVVDFLKSIHVNSSFANRKNLAAKYGIKNYRGTATQNTELLKKLRE